jgi:hypothetical protein
MIIVMEIAVVLKLKSSASLATGESIAAQAFS